MTDIIHLLPDNIANQIAAGEVIQRPGSAVKELLENAVDAGATDIQLIVQDAGKALIQVVDNGKGMSETDARLCFERHATSKIKNIEDLFSIRTMGFRGEALASIAAVAQVSLKTRRAVDETGSSIEIENSRVISQEPIAMAAGTSIAMKNLFFNIPARRNFLKSNAAEMRNVVDEFMRVALSFPEIRFSLISNGQQLYYLEPGSLKQRIVQALGAGYNAKLVSVQEKTDYLNIYGFVGKPETARKTRGDQYFFVNNRFIRSAYLNHAVMGAFHDLIPADSFPLYVLYIDLDPSQVDINVHPTKQEIKFEDEKIIYAFVQSAVKHALAQFSIMPALEFDLDPSIQQLDAVSKPFTREQQEAARGSDLYQNFAQKNQAHFLQPGKKSNLESWPLPDAAPLQQEGEKFVSLLDALRGEEALPEVPTFLPKQTRFENIDLAPVMQIQLQYILAATVDGFLLVHQQWAHERVLYEQFQQALQGKAMASQRSLFPATLNLSPGDAILLQEMIPDLSMLGYQIEPFGGNSFVVQGSPADVGGGDEARQIEKLLEQVKHFNSTLSFSAREKLIRAMATQHAVKSGSSLTETEMKALLRDLFACSIPNISPAGEPSYIEFRKDYLVQLFK